MAGKRSNLKKEKEGDFASDFANLASHQLRTPLSGMKWMLELLQRPSSGPLSKKQKEYIEKTVFFNQPLIPLLNDFLKISLFKNKQTQPILHPTDLTVI